MSDDYSKYCIKNKLINLTPFWKRPFDLSPRLKLSEIKKVSEFSLDLMKS